VKNQGKVNEIINAYNLLVKGIENRAIGEPERAYGGVVRAGKGLLVESMCVHLVEIAWDEIGGDPKRINFDKEAYKLPLNKDYLGRLKNDEVREYIEEHISDYYYSLIADVHVNIDNNFVMGIECKAYTENAMMKRILVDFTLLKHLFPKLSCVLFQLESQLGGDYSEISKSITFGSHSTHTLLSYFDVDLHIVTLLEGERKVDRPIHKEAFYKSLYEVSMTKALDTFKQLLTNYQ
jgi:hypothetical protein